MSDRDATIDPEVIRAAAAAAPIFAQRGWVYGRGDNAHIPDAAELAETVQKLVNNVRANITLDDDGFGHASRCTGRWVVERNVDAYLFDPSDDDITIMLALGTIEEPKIPKERL